MIFSSDEDEDEAEKEEEEEEELEHMRIFFFVTILALVILYIVTSNVMEKIKWKIGHATSIIMLIGFLISICIYSAC